VPATSATSYKAFLAFFASATNSTNENQDRHMTLKSLYFLGVYGSGGMLALLACCPLPPHFCPASLPPE